MMQPAEVRGVVCLLDPGKLARAAWRASAGEPQAGIPQV